MDTSAISNLVLSGISKLIELIPLWVNASAEERAKIEANARALVDGLGERFSANDKKDDAATQAARDAIKNASPK